MLERSPRSLVLAHSTPHFVRLARLQKDGGDLRVSAAAELPPGDTAAQRQWIKDHVSVSGNWIPAIAGFHPAGHRLVREDVPFKENVPQLAAARTALSNAAGAASAPDWHLGLLDPLRGGPLAGTTAMVDALIVGVPRAELVSHQRQLLKQHLRPRRLELDTLPLLGALARHATAHLDGKAVALCQFGQQETTVYIVDREGVKPQQPVSFGLQTFTQSAQKDLKLDDLEATAARLDEPDDALRQNLPRLLRIFASHLRLCLDYYEHQTGRTVRAMLPVQLPTRRAWLGPAMCEAVDLPRVTLDIDAWAADHQLRLDALPGEGEDWWPTLALAANPQTFDHGEAD